MMIDIADSASSSIKRIFHFLFCASSIHLFRKKYFESCASSKFAFDYLYTSSVILYYLLYDSKAKSNASFLCRKERFENYLSIFGWHSLPIIAKREIETVCFRISSELDYWFGSRF